MSMLPVDVMVKHLPAMEEEQETRSKVRRKTQQEDQETLVFRKPIYQLHSLSVAELDWPTRLEGKNSRGTRLQPTAVYPNSNKTASLELTDWFDVSSFTIAFRNNKGVLTGLNYSVCEYLEKEVSEPCKPGFFGKGGDECQRCDPGRISSKAGSLKCKRCKPGKIPNSSQTKCVPIGSKQTTSTQKTSKSKSATTSVSAGRRCTAGFYLLNEVCTRCRPGTVSITAGANSCERCPVGQIANGRRTRCLSPPGAHPIPTCPAGSYKYGDGCNRCGRGKISTSPGSTRCQSCAQGEISNARHTKCLKTGAGSRAKTS